MDSSSQTIVAIKGEGFAILAGKKACEVFQNIYYGASGDPDCCEKLEQSLNNAELPPINSVRDAASFVTNHINRTCSQGWAENKVRMEILLVGNIINTAQFHLFQIRKSDGGDNDYEMTEINESTAAIGCGAEVREIIGTFSQNSTIKDADLIAFKAIRKSTVGVVGDIQIISIRREYAVESVLEQDDLLDCNSDYTTRSDTHHDPNDPTICSVTYGINYDT